MEHLSSSESDAGRSTADAAADSARAPSEASSGAPVGQPTPPFPFGWTDILTGTDGPRLWDRLLTVEQARNMRHRRTATVALVEVAGFEAAALRWGPELALQLFIRLARVLASGIRSSDHVARIGPTRFGVLLTETDEVLAINFVDRVRSRCLAEIDPAANGMRVVIGWASPEVGGRLDDAQRVAEERLTEALRREQ